MSKKSPAKILKEKGLIPKTWDLRKPLTDYKKRIIRAKAKEFPQLIRAPGKFTARKVAPATAEKLKAIGYMVSGNRAIIPNRGGTVHVSAKGVNYDLRDKTETVYVTAGANFLARLKVFALNNAELDAGEEFDPDEGQWAIRIGNSPESSNLQFTTLRELLDYLFTAKFHSGSATSNMVLVRVVYKQDFRQFKHMRRD